MGNWAVINNRWWYNHLIKEVVKEVVMAFLEIKNVRIAGIAASVPKTVVNNHELSAERGEISSDYTADMFVKQTGIEERRYSPVLCTSDLCYAAAEQLIGYLGWKKSEIDALLFVSQTADYSSPATACILQDRLGLDKETYAADISMGCTGWVYGLSVAASLASHGSMRKVLLCVGDAKRRAEGPLNPLIGSAGTVTAIEYAEGVSGFKFHMGTDGSRYDAIIIPDSGSRNQVKPESFKCEIVDGRPSHRMLPRMKGMDVFAFGIYTAPKSIKMLSEKFGINIQCVDYLMLHQANMQMNSMIVKKVKLPPEKAPSSIKHFGNTSSASIPVTFVTQLKGKVENRRVQFICCAFGVGLSWGTVAFDTDKLVLSDLVEVDDTVAVGDRT